MNKIKIILVTVFLVCVCSMPAMAANHNDAVRMIPSGFSELAEKAKPAVVNIQTVKVVKGGGRVYRHFFGNPFGGNRQSPFDDFPGPFFNPQPQNRKEQSLGSGFIISEDGYIVTNNHVIKDADKIKVILHDNTEYEAEIVGTDPITDIALIKVTAENLVPLEFGSSEKLNVGSWVVAIGSPFGLEQTVTAGIVSAKGRIIGSGPYDDFIQTDASINPGNSGGPLLNLKGEVIGINTAIISSGQGIGFAIPSDMATGIIEQLTEGKSVSRGWMGIAIQNITPELAEYYNIKETTGVFVAKVYPGDPAAEAGIEAGDIIFQIGDKTIKNSRDLTMTVASAGVGEKVKVLAYRNGKEKTFRVKLGKRPNQDPEQLSEAGGFDEFGLKLESVTPRIARQLGYPEDFKGLVVTQLSPGSQAAKTSVRPGDLLLEVNRQSVSTYGEYQKIIGKAEKGNTVFMLFKRGNRHVFVVSFRK